MDRKQTGKAVEQAYPRMYLRLKNAGMTANKVVEAVLDAERGSEYAIRFIRAAIKLA